jgi:hypothetical protein
MERRANFLPILIKLPLAFVQARRRSESLVFLFISAHLVFNFFSLSPMTQLFSIRMEPGELQVIDNCMRPMPVSVTFQLLTCALAHGAYLALLSVAILTTQPRMPRSISILHLTPEEPD